MGIELTSAEILLAQGIIDGAEALINRYCGTNFNYNLGDKDYVDGHEDLEWWYLKNTPLISITSVTLNGTELTDKEDYWAYPEYGCVRFLKGLLNNVAPRNVVITYSWGHTAVPEGVKYAHLEMVKNAFNNYRADYLLEGATGGQIANMSLQFEKLSMLTEEIMIVLKTYKQMKIVAIG